MDALSSSVSSLNIPTIQSSTTTTSRELYHFKIPNPSHLHHLSPNPQLCSTKKPNSKFSNLPTIFTYKNNSIPSPLITTSQAPSLNHPPTVHRNAATGYAAALIDAAQCKNTLAAVKKDVKRLAKLLRNKQLRAVFSEGSAEEREKGGRVVKEVVEKGGFERHLVVLVKMLVQRNKFGMLKGVLDEFERIYELLGGIPIKEMLCTS